MSDFLSELTARYPVFHQVTARWRASRFPVVLQSEASECGAACLAIVLGGHGHHVTVQEARARMPVTPGLGVSARQLLAGADAFALRGRVVACDLNDLRFLEPGAILHWQMNHYVVLEHADDDGVAIIDPGAGRVTHPWREVSRAFSGVALVLEPGEQLRRKGRAPSPVWRWAREILSEPAWFRVVLVAVVLQALAFSLPALTGVVIERVVPQADRQLLAVATVATAMLAFFQGFAFVVRGRITALIMMRVGLRLRVDFVERLLKAPLQFVFDRPAGSIAYLQGSVESVLQSLTTSTLTAAVDGTMALLFVGLLLLAAPTLGLVVLVVFVLQLAIAWWTFRRMTRVAATELHVARKLSSTSTEAVYGFESVKALGLEQAQLSNQLALVAALAQVRLEGDGVQAVSDALQSTIRFVAPLALLLLGASSVVTGASSIGQMLSLTALAAQTLLPLVSLTALVASVPRTHRFLVELEDVLTAPAEQDASLRRPAPELSGAVRLERVSFRYGPLLPAVLEDVSLDVRPGEFVAIVGTSGSGKSTLAGVIIGLLSPERGRVRFDGEELSQLELTSVRRQLGYVPQRPHLFNVTVRENLTLGDPSVPMERVVRAARRAQLHEQIEALPLGYQTTVSNFSMFSGGERQRLAIARALVHDPKLLVLDEATSAMDTITEARLSEVIEAMGCTRIVIAHRLSTIERADRIVVMHGGRIVGQGRFSELRASNEAFRQLFESQWNRAGARPANVAT